MVDWSRAATPAVGVALALVVFAVLLSAALRRGHSKSARFALAEFDRREAHAFKRAVTRRLRRFLGRRGFVLERVSTTVGFAQIFFRSPDCRLLVYRDWKRDHEVNALLALPDKPLPADVDNGWRYVWGLLKDVDPASHARLTKPLAPLRGWPDQLDAVAGLLERHFPDFLTLLRSETAEPEA